MSEQEAREAPNYEVVVKYLCELIYAVDKPTAKYPSRTVCTACGEFTEHCTADLCPMPGLRAARERVEAAFRDRDAVRGEAEARIAVLETALRKIADDELRADGAEFCDAYTRSLTVAARALLTTDAPRDEVK